MNRLTFCLAVGLGVFVSHCPADEPAIDFNRDIRPLLSNNCYACHGPDEQHREGGFRLDKQEGALGEADSGERPIVPGDVAASELYARISTEDADLQMPPADSGKTLKPDEIERIRRWIEQGAAWGEHWSFVPPQRPPLPAVGDAGWVRNEIDSFILAKLEQQELKPSPEAGKTVLIRRLTFDLTGLPPTLAEVDAFLADESPEAYEKLVDRLLRSPHYGEHMARFWLDTARYGDTHGLHLDNYREMWPYRDWVVNAFNQNMSYDQFTIEQLAGDLLPNAALQQLIATGFNRCHVTTNEGGSISEEVYVRNVVDRVVTTGTVFMGMTFECTRCHDHKYDPFTMRDFYSMFAFFNNLDGNPMDGNKKDPAPVVRVLLPEQQQEIAQLRGRIEESRREIAGQRAAWKYVEPAEEEAVKEPQPEEVVWVEDSLPQGARAEGDWKFATAPQPVFSGERSSTRTASGLSQHFFQGAKPPLEIQAGDVLFAHVYLDPQNPPKQIMLQWNDGSWEHRAYWGGNHIDWGRDESPSRLHIGDLPESGTWVRLEVPVERVGLMPGGKINGWAFTQFDGTTYWDKAGVVKKSGKREYRSLASWIRDQQQAKGASLPPDIQDILGREESSRSDEQQRKLRDYFVEHVDAGSRGVFDPLHRSIAEANKRIGDLEAAAATTLVFRERKEPKAAYLLNRGEYDQRRDEVPRATPRVLPPLPAGAPLDRLGFARWLVDRQHPLTARVAVNRFWQQLFGVGIVKTAEDFGSQGEPPSHPQLLDWLAVHFMENSWDVKALMKQMVMSATYRQSSRVTPELMRRDPQNRLLARGPRFRLDAEMLRDQALAVSGLLVDKLGGPSVKPPQPDGLWFAVGYSGSDTVRFKPDQGADKVYRRTLYTFIKRTAPPPQMSTFDAPSREACTARRERTNTPLQALLLMNDPQFVEAARALAERIMHESGPDEEARAAYLLRLCTAREPESFELSELAAVYHDHLAIYSADREAAAKLVAVGPSTMDETLDLPQLAAWTMVANLVLNLDEVINKN